MEQMPAEGAPQGEQAAEGGDGGDQMSALLSNLAQGTQMLAEVTAGSPIAEKTQQLMSMMQEIAGMIGGGGEQAPAEGAASMEAGAAQAQPMSPAAR